MESVTVVDIGHVKDRNEDRVLSREIDNDTTVLVVADGLGGQPGGAEAAQIAIDWFESMTSVSGEKELLAHITGANDAIIAAGDLDRALYCMGCTADIAVIQEREVIWAHIGDSRLYRFYGGELHQVTIDQNLAEELFADGEITREECANHSFQNFLSQCLGEDDIEPESGVFTAKSDEILLLCTDGLHGMLNFATIQDILRAEDDLQCAADRLLDEALRAGGVDNIGLVLCAV